jgi:hypothetical protein
MIRHDGDHLKAHPCGIADSASHPLHFPGGTKIAFPALAERFIRFLPDPQKDGRRIAPASRTDAEEQWRRDVSHAPWRCCCRAWLLLW